MLGILRLVVFVAIGLTVMYFVVSIYSRSVRREHLEKKFDAGDVEGDRDTYIAEGMAQYEHGLRKRLIWLVYVIPTLLIGVTVYLVNYQ